MPAPPAPALGDVLDQRYRLVGRLGHGGFGDVYRAEELLPDGAPFRDVALKLLHVGGQDVGAWTEEAKLLASFRHPSLVTVYAAGILDGETPRRFVAMELLEGQNLADLRRVRGRVPWRKVLSWAVSAAGALDVIHAAGVVHLDLKPQNLYLCEGGALKVLDFGIARRAAGEPSRRSRVSRASNAPLSPKVPVSPPAGQAKVRAEAGDTDPMAATGFVVHEVDGVAVTAPSAVGARLPSTPPAIVTPRGEGRVSVTPASSPTLSSRLTRSPRPDLPSGLVPSLPSSLAATREAVARTAPSPEDAFAATRPVPSPFAGAGASPIAASIPRRFAVGTPGYMAPEVLELGEPTAAADAYALAVCVVELCTGHLPHEAPDEPESWDDPTAVSQWLDALRKAQVAGALRDFDAEPGVFPRGLSALLRRLLAVDPEERGVEPGQLGALFDEVWERPFGKPERPYFGLSPFPPEGEGLLFGRDDDVSRLGRELCFEPVVVLQGGRGVGKSSLAVAGLVPYLARRGADGKDDWRAVNIAPGADGDRALDEALASIAPDLRGARIDDLAAHCSGSAVGLVLLVDPLEEALHSPRLLDLIESIALEPARPGLRLVASLGEEHTAEVLATPQGASLRAALRFVGAPTTAAVQDIVVGPARSAGGRVSGASVIANDVQAELRRGGGSRLPCVALALEALWEARDKDAPLEVEAKSLPGSAPMSTLPGDAASRGPVLDARRWKAMGGVPGAMVRHAGQVFARLEAESPADRALALEILLRLSSTDGRPLAWALTELVDVAGPDRAATERMLALLDREHLVAISAGSVEIGHQALLTAWPLLTSARLAAMDRLSFLERLRGARLAYERADEHTEFLLHGALLGELRAQVGAGGEWRQGFAPADRAFADKSLGRARLRRLTRIGAGALVALAAGAGLLVKARADRAYEAEVKMRAEAQALEEVSELAARGRRTDDPYLRTAFLAAAYERGLPDGLVPLELFHTAQNLTRADFVTLDRIVDPVFPWNDRFLVGSTSAATLSFIDFLPREPDVIEDVDLDFDPGLGDLAAHVKRPRVFEMRPHEAPVVERVAFAFDTALATRSATGEVKVFRVRDDGSVALAAVAPFRCVGALRAAPSAAVLACATEPGIVRWDLAAWRKNPAAGVDLDHFPGNVIDVSEGGERVIAAVGRRVLFWGPRKSSRVSYRAESPVLLARESPRDGVVAVVTAKKIEVLDARVDAPSLFDQEHGVLEPEWIRWDAGGLDLAVCGPEGGSYHYLKLGGRSPADPKPEGAPCERPRLPTQPKPIQRLADYASLADRDFGPHLPLGGYRLRRQRVLTRDLVVLDALPALATGATPPATLGLLHFQGHDEIGGDEVIAEKDSISAVERDASSILFQVGDEIRVYAAADHSRVLTRKGNFLRRCGDGRPFAWVAEGDRYRAFDAWTGAALGAVKREPGFVVTADAACTALFTQRLDGTLVRSPLDGGDPKVVQSADGYVIDARPSAFGGVWLSFGSGALGHLDDAGKVTLLGYATPYASAIGDGPKPGELAMADAAGVWLLRAGSAPKHLLDGSNDTTWEDLSVAPEGASMLLVSADRVAALDLARRELLGSIPIEGRDRFARWDDDGSVLLWSHTRHGGAEGAVIPRGIPLARAVASAVSNLTVDRKGRLALPE